MSKKRKIYLQQKHTLIYIKSSTIKNKLFDNKAHSDVAPKVNAASRSKYEDLLMQNISWHVNVL